MLLSGQVSLSPGITANGQLSICVLVRVFFFYLCIFCVCVWFFFFNGFARSHPILRCLRWAENWQAVSRLWSLFFPTALDQSLNTASSQIRGDLHTILKPLASGFFSHSLSLRGLFSVIRSVGMCGWQIECPQPWKRPRMSNLPFTRC